VTSAITLGAAPGVRIVGQPRIAPDSVTVTGPRRQVSGLRSVSTVRERVTVADSLPITVALDTARVPGRVRPASVRVTVPVQIEPPLPVAAPADGDSARVDSAARAVQARGAAP
jgi:hypothetical protein